MPLSVSTTGMRYGMASMTVSRNSKGGLPAESGDEGWIQFLSEGGPRMLGKVVRHRDGAYLNRLEQHHRVVEGSIRSMRGFMSYDATKSVQSVANPATFSASDTVATGSSPLASAAPALPTASESHSRSCRVRDLASPYEEDSWFWHEADRTSGSRSPPSPRFPEPCRSPGCPVPSAPRPAATCRRSLLRFLMLASHLAAPP